MKRAVQIVLPLALLASGALIAAVLIWTKPTAAKEPPQREVVSVRVEKARVVDKDLTQVAYRLVRVYAARPGGLVALTTALVAERPHSQALQELLAEFQAAPPDVLPLPEPEAGSGTNIDKVDANTVVIGDNTQVTIVQGEGAVDDEAASVGPETRRVRLAVAEEALAADLRNGAGAAHLVEPGIVSPEMLEGGIGAHRRADHDLPFIRHVSPLVVFVLVPG